MGSWLCSGDARKVELYLTKSNYHTKGLLEKHGLLTEMKELSELLAKLLDLNPLKRPSLQQVLDSDSWINGHV